MGKNKFFRIAVVGILSWLVAIMIGLKWGAVDDVGIEILTQLRLPRILLASALGMGLSVAGAALQALFANPLCEPYTLGISSGSALGAVIGTSLGFHWIFAGLAGPAFLGAIFFAFILYLISLRAGSGNATLLLSGVMLGFLGTSLVALWISISDSNGLQGAMVWLFGDLSRARLKGALFSMVGVLWLMGLIWRNWRELDALLMGEEGASALGVDVPLIRRRIILLTSLMIGLCVSAGGVIGFVGLVVPHFSRRLVGSLHRTLIPICAIWGAVALTTADWISRVLSKPYELPIGVVTALVGAPIFLGIMMKKQEKV